MQHFCSDFLSRLKDVRFYSKAEKSAASGKTSGVFGGNVVRMFPGLAIEDKGRLRSLKIREHFLTKLFTLASFREVRKSGKISDLTRFQADNKFLLMAYNQKKLRTLGNLAANRDGTAFHQTAMEYENHLRESMEAPARRASNVNVFMHIFGYFSKQLSSNEKQFFFETLQLYRDGRVPFTSALGMLKGWTIRFQDEYLTRQTFFEPFPVDLVAWSDAGRPIEL
jgi:uncharacterized protein YbgA (DUF1722 family)